MRFFPGVYSLFKNAEYAEYFSQNLAVVYDNRVHAVIFGLEPDMTVFLIKSLNGSGIVNKRYYHVSIGGSLAGIHKNPVAAENTGVYHGITLDI